MNIFKCCNDSNEKKQQKQSNISRKDARLNFSMRSLAKRKKEKQDINKTQIKLSQGNQQQKKLHNLLVFNTSSVISTKVTKIVTFHNNIENQTGKFPGNTQLITPCKRKDNLVKNQQVVQFEAPYSSVQSSSFAVCGSKTPNTEYNSNLFKKPHSIQEFCPVKEILKGNHSCPNPKPLGWENSQKQLNQSEQIHNSNILSTFDKIDIKKTQSICSSLINQSDQISEVLELPNKLYLSHLVSTQEKKQKNQNKDHLNLKKESLDLFSISQNIKKN